MFRFVKFTKVQAANTVLEFRGQDDSVTVHHFSDNEELQVSAVSLEGESDAIDAVIASQSADINCTKIEKDEFKTLVENSAQLKRIRQVVKDKISKEYDNADEMAMSKRSADDAKRVKYEEYVQTCLSVGYGLKDEIGY